MKASPILVCPVVQLHRLPDIERDVLRRFFCEHVRGMDAKHDRRWRRFVRDLFNAQPGEGFQIYRAEERGGPYHRRHRAILGRLFDAQERFRNITALHEWLKLKACFVTWGDGKDGQPKLVTRSTSFDQCSEQEMQEFHDQMIELLHDPVVQRYLFPQVRARDRQGMVDAALVNPNEAQP